VLIIAVLQSGPVGRRHRAGQAVTGVVIVAVILDAWRRASVQDRRP
jgi:hypothetical protein